MKFSYRLFTISFIAICTLVIISLSSCRKETQVNPTQQTQLATYYIKGLLGNNEIIVQGSPSYFTDSLSTNGSIYTTSNQHDEDSDDDDEDDKTILVTGCNWHSTDHAGNTTTTGTVQIRKEVFRIYVTPFLSSHYYGMIQAGAYNFAYTNNTNNGAYISLTDKAGVLWTSKGEQTGSTFQITSRGASQQAFTTITGVVTCKMYNTQGNVQPFSGTFSAIVGL